MNNDYSPDTLEHIATNDPAEWMGRAPTDAPAYNPSIESCYFQGGGWVIVGHDMVKHLDDAKKAAYTAIDNQAGTTRSKYITTVPGQSETYLSKASDAATYKAVGYPSSTIANYPMVQAEARAIYGATPTVEQYQAAADDILTTQSQWIGLSAAIEQQRRAGKIAVGAAETVLAVQAAQQAAVTALSTL